MPPRFYSIDRVAAVLEQSRDAGLTAVYDAICSGDIAGFAATEEFRMTLRSS
jgi:hypothetical protein